MDRIELNPVSQSWSIMRSLKEWVLLSVGMGSLVGDFLHLIDTVLDPQTKKK